MIFIYKGKVFNNIIYNNNINIIKYRINEEVKLNIHQFETNINNGKFVLKNMNNPLYREQTWESSDKDVATVNEFGEIEFLKVGNVTIKCTNKYGKYDECTFKVYDKDYTEKIPYDKDLGCCVYSIFAEDYNNGNWKARKYDTYTTEDGTIYGGENVKYAGAINKIDNYISFDGNQSINTLDYQKLYGWASVKNYTRSDFIYCMEFSFDKFTNIDYMGFTINTNGEILANNNVLHTLELNKKYKIILLRRYSDNGRFTINGFRGRIIIASNGVIEYDSDYDKFTAGGTWVYTFQPLQKNGICGKFYSLKLFVFDSVSDKSFSAEKNDLETKKWIDEKIIQEHILGDGTKISKPILNFVNRYVVNDLAENKNPKIGVSITNPDKLKYDDKIASKYDLIQFDRNGVIEKIYKNILEVKNKHYQFETGVNRPYRDYLYFGLYDNNTKTIQKSRMFSIRQTDSRIDKSINKPLEEETIAKGMYISPRTMIGRPGNKKLLRPTFVPEQVKNIKVKYISTDTTIATVGENDGIVEMKKQGYCEIMAISQSNTKIIAKSTIIVKPSITPEETVTIDIDRFNIIKDNNDYDIAWDNTNNINTALSYYKNEGYKKIILPAGHYYMACEQMNVGKKYNRKTAAITPPSDCEIVLTDCIIEQVMCEFPDCRVIVVDNCDNTTITGGTVIGDLFIHNYGMRINENGNMLEEGSYYSTTGEPLNPNKDNGETYYKLDKVHTGGRYFRTKDFIDHYEDYETTENEPLPSKFNISPLWKTTMNTVDGGQYYCFSYDKDGKFLGIRTGGFGTTNLPENTAKIKLSFRSEEWDKAIYCMTRRDGGSHATFEFGTGVGFKNSFDCELNSTIVKNCQGDVSMTSDGSEGYMAFEDEGWTGFDTLVCDNRWINCELKEARRQGISFVATGENYLILGGSIGNINGVDPQCGTDMEAYGRNEKYLFKNVRFHDNRKWDMVDCFSGDVEIDSCTYNGSIGLGQSSYNWYVHDCNFIYDDKYSRQNTENEWDSRYKIHNSAGFGLGCWNTDIYTYMIAENNHVDGGNTMAGGMYAFGATNTFMNNNTAINCSGIEINCKAENLNYTLKSIRIKDLGAEAKNCYFNPMKDFDLIIVFEMNDYKNPYYSLYSDDKNKYYLNKNSNNKCTISSAYQTIGMINNYTIYNLAITGKASGLTIIDNCNIINDDDHALFDGGNMSEIVLRNCNIDIPRKWSGYNYAGQIANDTVFNKYYGVVLENCNINIRDIESTNNKDSIEFFAYGYGEFACPIFVNGCTITSNKKVVLISTHINNCTFKGGAVPYPYDPIVSINCDDTLNYTVSNDQQDFPFTVSNSNGVIQRRVLWETPIDSGIEIYRDQKITCKKAGTFKLKAKSMDGGNVEKEITIIVSEANTN